MRVFVSEYTVGGATLGASIPDSMRSEGLLMLQAVTTDIAQISDCSVVTTLESGLNIDSGIEVVRISDASEERRTFLQLLKDVDAVLVIAPETGGVLSERCQSVRLAGTTSWNCSQAAIELCGDKLRLFKHLRSHNIPTILTESADLADRPNDQYWPIVLKPRDGAGSRLTFLLQNHCDWDRAIQLIRAEGESGDFVVQPFQPGLPLSVGVNVSLVGRRFEFLPIAEQQLSQDGRFRYLGGMIPANITPVQSHRVLELVQSICNAIFGLAGYIGIDLVLNPGGEPLVVEVNPRITTSYVGYRRIVRGLLPELWTNFKVPFSSERLARGSVAFSVEEKCKL